MPAIVIASAVRNAVSSFNGALGTVPSHELGAIVIREALARARTGAAEVDYAIKRHVDETNRLYGVLNRRLADREFLAGDSSIADVASYPWVVPCERQWQNLDDFPHLKRWLHAIRTRPATVRAYALEQRVNPHPSAHTDEQRKLLFVQTAANQSRS